MLSFLRTAFLVAAAILGLASGAQAQQMKPCKADAARFCPGLKPGSDEMIQCIKDNKDKLSPECRAAAQEKGEKYKQQQQEQMPAPAPTPEK